MAIPGFRSMHTKIYKFLFQIEKKKLKKNKIICISNDLQKKKKF